MQQFEQGVEDLNEENFDLAAYITDTDFTTTADFQPSSTTRPPYATNNNTMDQQWQTDSATVSVAEPLSASAAAPMPSAATVAAAATAVYQPLNQSQQLTQSMLDDLGVLYGGGGNGAPGAFGQAAAMPGGATTDTFHYVEKWLESCLHDENSSAESLSGMGLGSLVDASPVKILMSAIDAVAGDQVAAAVEAEARAAVKVEKVETVEATGDVQRTTRSAGKKSASKMVRMKRDSVHAA